MAKSKSTGAPARQVRGTFTLRRLHNTPNGNPRYAVLFNTESGELFAGTTKPDAQFTYELCRFDEGKPATASYHVTVGGQVIFDDLRVTP